MNILFLTDELNFADGVSTHLYTLISGLQNYGNINIFVMCSGGEAVEKFRDSNIKVFVNKNLNHKSRSNFGFISAMYSISRFCKDAQINIVHSHNHYAANISSSFLKIKFSKNIIKVQTIHGIIPDIGRLKHLNSDYFIAVNDHVSDFLIKKQLNERNITLIYNGISFGNDFKKEFNKKLKFISASRLEESKNVDLLIHAVSYLDNSYRQKAEFIIAGEGIDEIYLKGLNKKLKSGVLFPGLLKDFRQYLKSTDVLVQTSGNEGFPMTILEAASEKNLVITADFAGIENILENTVDGIIFKKGSADELADQIKFIIDNPEKIRSYTDSFYKKIFSEFNSSLMISKHINFYKNIL